MGRVHARAFIHRLGSRKEAAREAAHAWRTIIFDGSRLLLLPSGILSARMVRRGGAGATVRHVELGEDERKANIVQAQSKPEARGRDRPTRDCARYVIT